MQRGTKALDEMRKSIFDQSTRAIATNPALISEIFTIKTPREIEMLLTHLQINIDKPSNVAIKRYIDVGMFGFHEIASCSDMPLSPTCIAGGASAVALMSSDSRRLLLRLLIVLGRDRS